MMNILENFYAGKCYHAEQFNFCQKFAKKTVFEL